MPNPQPNSRSFLREYAWWIAKNVLGWVFILLSPVIGATLPGPGGIPLFILGFAMVSFPGKRNLTARVFRGIPIDLRGVAGWIYAGLASVVLPAAFAVLLKIKLNDELEYRALHSPYVASAIIAAALGSFALARLSLRVANLVILRVPRMRRKVRPKMRHIGIDLLPPRRRRRLRMSRPDAVDVEILDIDPKLQKKARSLWKRVKPWLKGATWVVLMLAIFYYMGRPVRGHWHEVAEQIRAYNPWRFLIAAAMFAVFLFFRCLTWLKMIKGFGYKLPLAAGTRIWSTGELARYLPGTIWQVLGRVYLMKPYGVPPAVCSTTQILDIATFLLANIMLGLACVLWFFGRPAAGNDDMRLYLLGAMCLVPLLGFGLHPKVFYGITGKILARLGKPMFPTRLSGRKLAKYFFGYLVGLLWQSAAIYVLLGGALHVKPDHWWQLAGPYCLAWAAGFTVGFMSPGGLGVREFVFVGLVNMTLGEDSRALFPNHNAQVAFMVFCSVLLRLWTIAGELAVAGIAYALDRKGAMNHPDAPGRAGAEGKNGLPRHAENHPSRSISGRNTVSSPIAGNQAQSP